MKAKFITENALVHLKDNLQTLAPLFREPTNDALCAALEEADDLKGKPLFKETQWELPPEPLIESKECADELANVRTLYLGLKDIPPAIAMDERLWAGLALAHYWSYVRVRWEIAETLKHSRKKGVARILEHFAFAHNPRRSFTRNAISRLWWLGRMTYDESLADPFSRTRVVMQDLGYIIDLLERNFSNNPYISRQFIDAVESARREVAPSGCVILRSELRTLCKHLNMIGGVYILDATAPNAIYGKIRAKALAIARLPGEKPVEETEPDEQPEATEADDNDDN